MKKLIFSIIILFTLINLVHSQTFTEITDFGWGHGIARSGKTFYDIDNDGLLDAIFIGFDYNYIHFEQNSYNSSDFNYVTNSALNELDTPIGAQRPFFIDVDNDNLIDMFMGTDSDSVPLNGLVYHYEQSTSNSYDFTLVSENFMGYQEYNCQTPVILDIDNDGLLDLIHRTVEYEEPWPESREHYYFYKHYEQAIPNSYIFNFISEEFCDLTLSAGWFNKFSFFDIDNDNLYDLFMVNDFGPIYHFEQDLETTYDFSLVSESFNDLDYGWYVSPTFVDIDSDNLIDLLISDYSNKVFRFEQEQSNSIEFHNLEDITLDIIDVGGGSSVAIEDIDHNGLVDLLIGKASSNQSKVLLYEQTSPGSFEFDIVTDSLINVFGNEISMPTICDVDSDGLYDLFVGDDDYNIKHYEQVSQDITDFELVTEHFNNLNTGNSTCFFDIDNDSLLDLLVGNRIGDITHYEQSQINSYNFILNPSPLNDIEVYLRSKPFVTDFNSDGFLDLFIGKLGGINYYEQETLNSYDFNLVTTNFLDIDVGYQPAPNFYDINGDDLEDLIIGSGSGGIYLYSQNPVAVNENFVSFPSSILNQNFPNPFNPSTTIEFTLLNHSNVELSILNIKGQKIKTLVNDKFVKGSHIIIWNGDDEFGNAVCSGIYLYKLNVKGKTESVRKCILMK